MKGYPGGKTTHGQRCASWDGPKEGDNGDGSVVLKLGSYWKIASGCEIANGSTPRRIRRRSPTGHVESASVYTEFSRRNDRHRSSQAKFNGRDALRRVREGKANTDEEHRDLTESRSDDRRDRALKSTIDTPSRSFIIPTLFARP